MKNNLKIKVLTLLLQGFLFISCNAQNQNLPASTNTQQIPVEVPSLDTCSKLTASIILCAIKDKNKNLWFGTFEKGLFRYNGKNYIHLRINKDPKQNIIRSLFEDKEGNIWVGTEDKIWRFDGKSFTNILLPQKNSFPAFTSKNSKPNPPTWIMSFMQDKNGKIWIGTGEGVFIYSNNALSCFLSDTNILNKGKVQLRAVESIFEDSKGTIWFGSGGDGIGEDGICSFDGKELLSFKPKGYGRCMEIIEITNGDLYISSGFSIFKYNAGSFENIAAQEQRKIWSNFILEDKNGKLWLAADNADRSGGLYVYANGKLNKFSTADVFFTCAVEDNKGNIWFGSNGNGLYCYNEWQGLKRLWNEEK